MLKCNESGNSWMWTKQKFNQHISTHIILVHIVRVIHITYKYITKCMVCDALVPATVQVSVPSIKPIQPRNSNSSTNKQNWAVTAAAAAAIPISCFNLAYGQCWKHSAFTLLSICPIASDYDIAFRSTNASGTARGRNKRTAQRQD